VKAEYSYTSTSSGDALTGLVEQTTIFTGRPTGDRVTQYTYYNTPTNKTTHGQLRYVTTAVGSSLEATAEYTYDSRGRVSSVIDAGGRETNYHYDLRDRLTSIVYPDPDGTGPLLSPVERYDYDVFGNVIATELINSLVEDSQLLVTSLIDGATYDGINRLAGQYSQRPDLTWYLYQDASGNVLRTSSKSTALASTAVTPATLASFAADNSRVSSSNVVNSDTTPANDANSRGHVVTYDFDYNGNLLQTVEYDATLATPDYRETHWSYDALNRPVRIVTPDPGAKR